MLSSSMRTRAFGQDPLARNPLALGPPREPLPEDPFMQAEGPWVEEQRPERMTPEAR